MASFGSMTRPPCADQEDMPKTWKEAELDNIKEKDVPTPQCWCGDVCKVKVATDRKKEWTEGRKFFVCPNYAHDRARPTNAYDLPPVC
uniref:GRF-type domain-containing protein n=1 Tax=Hordeum vulgare subsp. vulgare TaxID=112509 RepID=A0A8I6Y2S6_HORVV